jgi:hypothetical protein
LYNLKTTQYNYDYSILELAEDLVWSDQVKPACLPKDTTMDYAGQTGASKIESIVYDPSNLPFVLQPLSLAGVFFTAMARDPLNLITSKSPSARTLTVEPTLPPRSQI